MNEMTVGQGIAACGFFLACGIVAAAFLIVISFSNNNR